jgi:nicotinamidase-related amidase
MPFSLEDRVGPEHGMLIVVDMQNDFCHHDGIAGKRGRDMAFVQDMIPRLVNLVNQARAHNFPICFVTTSGNQLDKLTGLDGIQESGIARLRRRHVGRRVSRGTRTARR